MTPPSPTVLDDETLAALQTNLDTALMEREFVGDWTEPWPTVQASDLGERSVTVDVPGTKTKVKLELSYGIIRVESRNPYLGIDVARLVTTTGPGYAARMYCEC